MNSNSSSKDTHPTHGRGMKRKQEEKHEGKWMINRESKPRGEGEAMKAPVNKWKKMKKRELNRSEFDEERWRIHHNGREKNFPGDIGECTISHK